MSIFTYVYDRLTQDDELKKALAINKLDGTPAVFEDWTPDYNEFPYINIRFDATESGHFARREGTVYIDLFDKGDSRETERIKNRILLVMDREILNEDEEGRARIYSRTENPITEDEPNINHWSLEFTVIYWRADLVEHLEQE